MALALDGITTISQDAQVAETWLTTLSAKLAVRRQEISVYEDYYFGKHKLAFASEKFLEAFGGRFRQFADNWCDLVVDAVEERLNVEGFRFGGSLDSDDVAWGIWQANNLDLDSQIAHTEALIAKMAYTIVWPSQTDPDTPCITVEHPLEVITAHDPGNRRVQLAGIKQWLDEATGKLFATVYLPCGLYKFQSQDRVLKSTEQIIQDNSLSWPAPVKVPTDMIGVKWEPRYVPDEVWPLPNPLGVVPITPLVNRPRMLIHGDSEIRRVIPVQDAVNKEIDDMIVASEFAAYPQRWATGLEPEKDPETGEDRPPDWKPGVDRFFMVSAEAAKFGQFASADLGNYVKVIETLIQHIASQTRTPPHYFYLSGQFPSGESIKSAETGLVAKTRRRMRGFGEGWEATIRLALKVVGDDRADDPTCETIWGDPESRTESEHVDATLKKQALNVPDEQLWEDLGYTPTQISRFRAMRARAAFEGIVDPPVEPQGPTAGSEPPGA